MAKPIAHSGKERAQECETIREPKQPGAEEKFLPQSKQAQGGVRDKAAPSGLLWVCVGRKQMNHFKKGYEEIIFN